MFSSSAIIRKDFTLNGKDSLSFDGDLYKIQSNANAKQAYVHGIFAELRAKLPYNLSLNSNINYIKGHDITDNLPFAHIPPLFGMTELVYMYNKWGAKLYSRYNGWKRIEDYSLTGEDNEDKATPDGTPSWYTINIRINYKLSNEADFNFGLENLLDHHYRGFGSGISAPGRNFVFHVNINI